MEGRVAGGAAREAEAAEIEAELAQWCGMVNAATGRLVKSIARALETRSWQGWGINSASQWVAWKCGVSPARARTLVLMARRLGQLPQTRAGLEAGELTEDQVAVVCRHVPAAVDAQAATLARSATRSSCGGSWAPTPSTTRPRPTPPSPERSRALLRSPAG